MVGVHAVNREVYGLTAAEALEQIRRIKDLLDGDTQNQFHRATIDCNGTKKFDRQTMIINCGSH